ncbi:acyl-protein thioesterase 1 [Lophiostoma macrostomum CBS 122681]|uniref:Acyl-protein thioesterase 1 n=1 Tax=Lophiostoma macrostomum CBS 122681 TaxID=1314788 RepID=A0A6A6TRP2_9PLEO|nr:acyl-protein thioesterase 1 [Lophiostoma macrostomum CBS 122681]
MSSRTPPLIIPAINPPSDTSASATFIFIHGLGDDAYGLESIPRQFQAANKLPHLTWVLPNALFDQEAMQTAWHAPSPLSPFPSSRPDLDEEEDETGLKASVEYIVSLIDDVVAQGVPPNRIVMGGFSQGHALALLTGLISTKYSGKLGGLVGLSGYLPLADKIAELRGEAGLTRHVDDDVDVFLARGTRDMLVPKRHFRICNETLFGLGVKQEKVTVKEFEGMGHVMSSSELRDLCAWLERVIPPLE